MEEAMQDSKEIVQEGSGVYPLTFEPVFKDYPWGGRNLAIQLGRQIPDGIVAEIWYIAAHPNGSSVVRVGPEAGHPLPDVLERWGLALVGTRNETAQRAGKFPLLIKLLDANAWLSVQVHPADEYALEHEGEFGKTEMWVVLQAEPGAELIYGFIPGATRETFAQAIADGTTADWLYRLPVQVGDVVFVPAGTVHALGPGVIVAEIQQNSDTTYRIYDWGRPRPLHIEKALDVLDFESVEPQTLPPVVIEAGGIARELIGKCSYFETERLQMQTSQTFEGTCGGSTYEIWGVLQGSIVVTSDSEPVILHAVDWVLLPASLGSYTVEATSDATLIRVLTPADEEVP